jgi:predicted dehydrogenase
LALAEERGLRVGSAPDTFLGAGLQTCRKLIDDGWIGAPYGAGGLILMGNAANLPRPNIQPFLQLGWDPLFDMAPYYLTALVTLLGPVGRVSGAVGNVAREVTVTNPKSPQFGKALRVDAPQHAGATLEFAAGGVATLLVAKEGFGYTPRLEIYGTEANLQLPDPNMFSGPIRVQQPGGVSAELPFSHGFAENSRGVGLADMAFAIRAGRPHRASGALARHVLDITLAVFESSREGRHVEITAPVERPAPLPLGLHFGQLDQ